MDKKSYEEDINQIKHNMLALNVKNHTILRLLIIISYN